MKPNIMSNLPGSGFSRLVIVVGLLASAGWALAQQPIAPGGDAKQTADVDPMFTQLLFPGTRDAAARQLLARWEGQHVENLSIYGVPPVRHVLLCPQPAGDPMLLLFLGGRKALPVGRAEGPCVLLDAKGLFRHSYWVEDDVLLDINGDGVIEHVESQNVTFGKNPGDVNVQVLARLGNAESLQRVTGIMNEAANPSIRLCAAIPLRKLKNPAAKAAFWKALKDPYHRESHACRTPSGSPEVYPVRVVAADALIDLGEDPAQVRAMLKQGVGTSQGTLNKIDR